MAVQTFGQAFEVDGHAKSLVQFRSAHNINSNGILNAAEKRNPDDPRPPYDPAHPDNQYPSMLHHPQLGELTVGRSMVGVTDLRERARITKDNDAAWDAALAKGYREEPYAKPQLVVLDPLVEKAELLRKNQELQGQIVSQEDRLRKLEARLDAPSVTGSFTGPHSPTVT